MNIDALAVEMPWVKSHPNRLPFRGVLTQVDEASQRSPAGARGHRVLLTRAAAESALASLIGMALDHTPSLDGHDSCRKVGIITAAEIAGSDLLVEGYLFARDFPELVKQMRSPGAALGMSYELADARVEDVRAAVWKLTEVTFTGAAILLRSKAAYEHTSIAIQAQRGKLEIFNTGENEIMDKQQTQQLIAVSQRMAEAAEAMGATIARLDAQHSELSSKIERIVAAVDEEETLRQRITDLEQKNSELEQKLEARVEVNAANGKPNSGGRKTLPPVIGALLAKTGVEINDSMDSAALDATLATLSIEQRIAVKAQMARAGLIV